VQSREKREFWTEEESKNETRQVQSKKEKRFLDRGREQKRDKFRRKEKTISTAKTYLFYRA
jgi:hypothetical protein